MTERRRNPRRISAALDLVHLVIGGLVVILAVMAFLDPQAHPVFFPLIFFLAGASGVLVMFWFARHLNSREASANWREQMVNGITQLCVLLGILF